jgi:pseudouridine-5'-phosphate glycosidase
MPPREIHTLSNLIQSSEDEISEVMRTRAELESDSKLMVFAPVPSHIWSSISLKTRGLIYNK